MNVKLIQYLQNLHIFSCFNFFRKFTTNMLIAWKYLYIYLFFPMAIDAEAYYLNEKKMYNLSVGTII